MDISQYTDVPYEYVYEQLVDEEGVRSVAYIDTRGYTTLGIGHCCSSNPTKPILGRNVKVGQAITHDEVVKLFDHDLADVLNSLLNLPWFKTLTHNQQYVCISLVFNLGYGGLLKFKRFLEALEAGEIKQAAAELRDSKWFKQVGRRGVKLTHLLES